MTAAVRAVKKRLSHGRRTSKDWSNKAADRDLAAGGLYMEIFLGRVGEPREVRDQDAWFASLFWMEEIVSRLEEQGMKPAGRVWMQKRD